MMSCARGTIVVVVVVMVVAVVFVPVVVGVERALDVVAHHFFTGQNSCNCVLHAQNLPAGNENNSECGTASTHTALLNQGRKNGMRLRPQGQTGRGETRCKRTGKWRRPMVRNNRKALSTEKSSVTVKEELGPGTGKFYQLRVRIQDNNNNKRRRTKCKQAFTNARTC